MKLVNRIKKKVGTYFLKNEGDSVRRRKGSSFATATDVALLYEDSSEDFFKKAANTNLMTDKHIARVIEIFDSKEGYTLAEVQSRFGISEKGLHSLIERNNIPKRKQGKFVFVPKLLIDNLLN